MPKARDTRTKKWFKKFSRYGTHLPVLKEVNRHFKNIETIVEIGSGLISTIYFLENFSNLKSLVSYETKEKWYNEIKGKIRDKRHTYKLVNEEVDSIENIEDADLLFVDGMKGHRIYALNNFSKKYDLIVWHDSKMGKVVRDTNVERDYKYIYEFYPPIPEGKPTRRWPPTAVLSNKIDVSKMKWNCTWNQKWIETVIGYMKR